MSDPICQKHDCDREAVIVVGAPSNPNPYCGAHGIVYMELAIRIIEGIYERALIDKVKGEFGING